MKDLFAWVKWWQKLVAAVAAVGKQGLIVRAKKVEWKGSKSLLEYGDNNIDPFSFFYFLASKTKMTDGQKMFGSVHDEFDLPLDNPDFNKFKGCFPQPLQGVPVFHEQGQGAPDLLWDMFTKVQGNDQPSLAGDFNAMLHPERKIIKNVGPSKLTQTLFLMKPNHFLPHDGILKPLAEFAGVSTDIKPTKQEADMSEIDYFWNMYSTYMEAYKRAFSGCLPYEINELSNMIARKAYEQPIGHNIFQLNVESQDWSSLQESQCADVAGIATLKVGDVVVVRQGADKVLAVGVVDANQGSGNYLLWMWKEPVNVNRINETETFSPVDKGGDDYRQYREAFATTFKIIDNINAKNGVKSDTGEQPMNTQSQKFAAEIRLLKQFKQIILQGPPGTGKTWTAKQVVAELLGDGWKNLQGERWDIIQFHPSYNYEDFIRGIQVTTSESGQVTYETVDRILLSMAAKAHADKKANGDKAKPYILIIDEVNRANVAAVLGELIYALEYRGEKIRTTYELNGKSTIVLPDNLYIIGTMNTADRTIGQIDYAVRRRFAFVTLRPDSDVIKGNANATTLFDMVAELFKGNAYLSSDYNADDVAIGHSYFLASNDTELKNKILYQVVPILEEYLKDGVLLEAAKPQIEEIKLFFVKTSERELNAPPVRSIARQTRKHQGGLWAWENIHQGTNGHGLPLNGMIWDIVSDYIHQENPANMQELQKAFPITLAKIAGGMVVDYNDPALDIPNDADKPKRYFCKPDELLLLEDGTKVAVCNQWGASGNDEPYYLKFKEHVASLGYEIIEPK